MFMWSAESVSRGMWAAMKLSRAKMRSWHKQYQSSISNTMAILLENWTIEETTGYKPLTTFYTDFSIAEKFGLDGIKSTYQVAFRTWKTNYKYLTELAMVLNWKCWRWYEVNNEYSQLYTELYHQLDDWVFDNLSGEELEYYISTTD